MLRARQSRLSDSSPCPSGRVTCASEEAGSDIVTSPWNPVVKLLEKARVGICTQVFEPQLFSTTLYSTRQPESLLKVSSRSWQSSLYKSFPRLPVMLKSNLSSPTLARWPHCLAMLSRPRSSSFTGLQPSWPQGLCTSCSSVSKV